MHRMSRLAVLTVAAAAAAVSIAAPSASATYPAPDGPSYVIQRVEVPIDDTTSEAVQVIIALVFGAAAATLAHRRKGRDPGDSLNVPRPVAIANADTRFGTTVVLSR